MSAIPTGIVRTWPFGRIDELPDGPWLVAHAKPRQDKLLAAYLSKRGQPGVQFLEQRTRRYPGKGVQVSEIPLLGGYLFIAGGDDCFDILYESQRLVRIMRVPNPDQLRQDLIDLARLITTVPGPLEVRPELQAGMRVQLTEGSLAGLSGVIVRRAGVDELVVNVHMLGTAVAVRCSALGATVVTVEG